MKRNREYTVVIEKGEDGYLIGTVLELKGCHTQGETLEEIMKNIKEAIELCIDIEGSPEPYIREIVEIQKVEV